MNSSCVACQSEGMATHSILVVVAEIILMIIICGGNVMTILAILKTPKLQTIPNQYVLSLACADCIAGLLLPYQAALHFPGIQTIFDKNKYLCLSRHVAFFVSVGQTIMCITVIAVDRAVCIGFPFYYQMKATFTKTRIIIISTWVLAIFLGTILLYSNNWDSDVGCSLFKNIPMYFQVYVLSGTFVIFTVITASCYGYIFYIARKHQMAINRQLGSVEASSHGNNMKAAKMCLTVFGVFVICMFPGNIAVVLGHTVGLPNGVIDITILLALSNSGMNFFIYAVKNRDFRNAFAKQLCCRNRAVMPAPSQHSETEQL